MYRGNVAVDQIDQAAAPVEATAADRPVEVETMAKRSKKIQIRKHWRGKNHVHGHRQNVHDPDAAQRRDQGIVQIAVEVDHVREIDSAVISDGGEVIHDPETETKTEIKSVHRHREITGVAIAVVVEVAIEIKETIETIVETRIETSKIHSANRELTRMSAPKR